MLLNIDDNILVCGNMSQCVNCQGFKDSNSTHPTHIHKHSYFVKYTNFHWKNSCIKHNYQNKISCNFRVFMFSFFTGRHELQIQYADSDIQGSPFYPEVYDSSLVQVTAPDQGIVGYPVELKGWWLTCNLLEYF